ncbi:MULTISPECIES: hypothetical protein [Streptomyces]|uniref:hypothetical protein n=1 Tax=Streptomyces TaxID=1883 RepID=UPI0013DB811A|nr:hypothetical protein [Streptomyces aureoverticillatus]QIB45276.1 hypothetical protein G3H79_21605 [Streptomyces aureoverticillatus]
MWSRPVSRRPSRLSRPVRAAAVLCGAALTAALAGGCAEHGGLYVEGPALRPTRISGPVYVADALASPLQKPAVIGLTDDVAMSSLRWKDWGGPTARATGRLSGTWCLPGCSREPYDATLTLSGVERQDAAAYYRRATVEPVRPEALPPAAVNVQFQGIRLMVPEF